MSDGLRRFVGCDARIRPVLEAGGKAVSVGRAFRTVPDRTRIVIEERDRGCRVPGCDRSRWLHVHHIRHGRTAVEPTPGIWPPSVIATTGYTISASSG
ncbi:MAG TPA: HNH endonuclease signature motif containing protein [Acidimicrobiales bacterium]|nr:HNH endonuclease signature motif containing protein [Acidimicrobiales bacterium]